MLVAVMLDVLELMEFAQVPSAPKAPSRASGVEVAVLDWLSLMRLRWYLAWRAPGKRPSGTFLALARGEVTPLGASVEFHCVQLQNLEGNSKRAATRLKSQDAYGRCQL